MINNIRLKIIAGKINKIPEFYAIFLPKNARLHNKTTRSRLGRGQIFEAEAKASRPRPKFWPRGHFGLEDLTSLEIYTKLNKIFLVTLYHELHSRLCHVKRPFLSHPSCCYQFRSVSTTV